MRACRLSEAEYEQLADPSYVVSFDDKGRCAGLPPSTVYYLRAHDRSIVNIMRLVNDCRRRPTSSLCIGPSST